MAGRLLSEGPAAQKRARVCEPQAHHDRNRQHLLRLEDARRPSLDGATRRRTISSSPSKGRASPPTGASSPKRDPRSSGSSRPASRNSEASSGPVNWQFAATKRFDPRDFDAFLKLLPSSVDGLAIRHAVEVRNDSFRTAEFVDLARAHSVAVVIAGDSAFPLIADLTASFVYARIMGTTEKERLGYPGQALDAWAKRARTWANGGTPSDLAAVSAPSAKAPGARRFSLRDQRFQGAEPGRRDGSDRAAPLTRSPTLTQSGTRRSSAAVTRSQP